jgi:Na+/melibiose symporter-like transporter
LESVRYFLTDVVGLAPSLAAAANFIGRFGLHQRPITNPIRPYRTPLGPRWPFLLYGLLPFALAFAAQW